jgi:starch phosphorylase
MKFMMNGAITIGTYDGANIEIMEAVGAENFFLFGLRADEVQSLRGHYNPQHYIDSDPDLAQVIHLLESDHFSGVEPCLFRGILDGIRSPHDPWMTLADFRAYIDAQQRVETAWRDPEQWTRMSIRNCAASGGFSTDRTIAEYNRDIWRLQPLK